MNHDTLETIGTLITMLLVGACAYLAWVIF